MNVVLIIAAGCFVLLGAAFVAVFAKLLSPPRIPAKTDDIFSPERYRAMERVLDEDDQQFLRSQPGWSWRMEKRFRKSRVKIFRAYMQQLSLDFGGVCDAVKLLLISSKSDRPDLVRLLMKQQFRFACGMASMECKLVLYRFGWINVDVRALIRPLETVCAQLQSLALAPAQASAGI